MAVTLLAKGNKVLTQDHRLSVCPPELRDKVVNELLEIYHNPPWGSCAGMAAPQIGYPYNIFVALGEPYFNVKDVEGIGSTHQTHEGCFSVPHEVHMVDRFNKIIVHYEDGQSTEYDGFKAQVIQHEFDHIKGKLINDKKG